MMILENLEKTLNKMSQFESLDTANKFVDALKNNFRQRLGGNFLKVDFDKSDNNNGVVFIRFSKVPYTESNNDSIQESPLNFIISIEGFDGEGGLCDECGNFVVETLRYHDPEGKVRRLKRRSYSDINLVKEYLTKYIETYQEQLKDVYNEDVGTSSGACASAESGDELTIGGGAPDNSKGNIAVFKKRMDEVERRGKKEK